MEAFEEYIKSEYKNKYTVDNFKYSHNILIKFDKKTGTLINQYIIFVNVKFYDNNLNILNTLNLKFVDNTLDKVSGKKLINLSPSEVNNKFINAIDDIIDNIENKLREKISKIIAKINELNEFKREIINIIEDH